MKLIHIKRLLDACDKQGADNHGFIHFIPKELVENAQEAYSKYIKRISKRV